MVSDVREVTAEMRRLQERHEQAVAEYRDHDVRDLAATIAHRLPALLDAIERGLGGPDYVYDPSLRRHPSRPTAWVPDNLERTYAWEARNDLLDGWDGELWDPVEFATLIRGPTMWAKEVVLTRDEQGDPDETEIRWFFSKEEAERA